MTHTIKDVQENATKANAKEPETTFKITSTDVPFRAPKKIKGVITGQWKTVDLSQSDITALLTKYTFHKVKKTSTDEAAKKAIDDAKKKAPAFCMASFKNGIRKKDHVEQVFGFVFDYDNGYTIAEFKEAVKDCGLFYVLYETFTSSPELEKFRAVFPFADRVPFDAVSDWREAHNGFAVELGIPLTFDPTCWQPERLFFNPSRALGEKTGKTFVQDGACVDPLGVDPVAVIRKDSSGKIIEAAELEPLMLTVKGNEIDFRQHWNGVQHDIQLAQLVEERQPDMIRKSRQFGGSHIQCPHDEEHGNKGQKDTATFVDNPNGKNSSTLSCRHGHCEHRETADHVFKLITDGKIEFADVDPAANVSDFIEKLKQGSLNADGTEKKPPVQFYTKVYSAMTLAKALKEDNTPKEILNVLRKLAREALSGTENAFVLKIVKTQTGIGIVELRSDLAKEKNKIDASQERGTKKLINEATKEIIAEMNKKFAYVKYESAFRILVEDEHDKQKYTYMNNIAFNQHYGGDPVIVTDKKDKQVTKLDKVRTWTDAERNERRHYDHITFRPFAIGAVDPTPDLYFNIWRGFAVDPIEGNWELLRSHILENICQGNEEHFKWVMAWFSQMVQQPEIKLGSSITLHGEKGTGKSKLADWVNQMCGIHGFLASNTKRLTGNFNAHMGNCLFFQNEEASWAGDVQGEGVVKNLITSPTLDVEKKGLDTVNMDNFTRIFTTTNNEWAVAATSDERRHMVLEMGKGQMQNGAYFAAIDEQMNKGGLEAMLFDFARYPYQKVDLRNPPRTEALARQVMQGFSSHERWIHDVLINGTVGSYNGPVDILNERTPLHTDNPTLIETEEVYHAYHEFCIRHKLRHEQSNVLMRNIGKYQVGTSTTGRGKNVKRFKVFPALPNMRKTFTEITNVQFEDEELV